MQQATLIGYISAEVHKHVIPDNYKGTISTSQSFKMKMQERVLFACLLPLLQLEQFWL